MKILVVGSGGREHALVWKIGQSKKVKKVFCAPGNAGISQIAECVDIVATDVRKLLAFALAEKIDLTVVGPESALVAGIVDTFTENGLRIFGPTRLAAELEGSKVFSKEFLQRHAIPTAPFKVFTESKKAKKYLESCRVPVVIKADGLADGKGVVVAASVEEAKAAVDLIMAEKAFGAAGEKIIIEDCLRGEEASFIAFTDGKTVLPLPTSQDHKAAFDNDEGPNTGGMGAYSPAPVVTPEIADFVMNKVMLPTVKGLEKEGRPYKGMLYAGLMIDQGKVSVLEFNCRFGDPEAQPLLMRLKSDIVDILQAVIDNRLDRIEMKIDPRPTVCVVMTSAGYPGSFEKGKIIKGLKKAAESPGVEIFHAGTARDKAFSITLCWISRIVVSIFSCRELFADDSHACSSILIAGSPCSINLSITGMWTDESGSSSNVIRAPISSLNLIIAQYTVKRIFEELHNLGLIIGHEFTRNPVGQCNTDREGMVSEGMRKPVKR